MSGRTVALTLLLLAAAAVPGCASSEAVPTPGLPSAGAATFTATAAPNASAPTSPVAVVPAAPPAAPAAPPAPPAPPPPPVPPPGVEPREVIRTDFGALTGVRVGRHPGFDRVVFEFGTTVPGYRVRYVPLPVKADGSGEPVPLPGARAALEVVFTPASGVDGRADPPAQTYSGPTRIASAETVQITEVTKAGDFEAVLIWATGLRSQVPFTVTTLASPPRVVIDLRHRP